MISMADDEILDSLSSHDASCGMMVLPKNSPHQKKWNEEWGSEPARKAPVASLSLK